MTGFSRRKLLHLAAGSSLVLARPSIAAPLDESSFVRIGGIDQWVTVRGHDSRNPAILYLHGGPGEVLSPFLSQFQPWEQDFTVINWDQRGAGKTYGRNGPSTPDMTVERLADDAIEIAAHFCSRLSQRKLILVGQSWGSLLGANVIKRKPDLFHAFVGTGQFVSIAASIPERLQWARQKANAANDRPALKAMDDAEALTGDQKILGLFVATNKWMPASSDLAVGKAIQDFAVTSAEFRDGGVFSGSKIAPAIFAADLRKLGDMPIPFFVFQGRDDHITPFEMAKAYMDEVRAPKKAFVAIDGGHYACFTNADQFVAALRTHVRPLVT